MKTTMQLKVLKPLFCVFLGSSMNLECHEWLSSSTWGFWVFVSAMANSLIAVVSYCMHCKVCMHLNYGICTSSTDYLYPLLTCIWCAAFSLNVSLSYTTSLILQDYARPLYTVMSIINAPCSQAPNQLSVGTASDQKKAGTQLVYTFPIPSPAKQLHKQY